MLQWKRGYYNIMLYPIESKCLSRRIKNNILKNTAWKKSICSHLLLFMFIFAIIFTQIYSINEFLPSINLIIIFFLFSAPFWCKTFNILYYFISHGPVNNFFFCCQGIYCDEIILIKNSFYISSHSVFFPFPLVPVKLSSQFGFTSNLPLVLLMT